MKDDKVIFFDCFGLFAGDAVVRYFIKHYGEEEGMKIKNFYCEKGDAGEITYAQFLSALEKDLHINIEEFQKELDGYYAINESMLNLAKTLKKSHHVIMLSNVMDGVIENVFRHYDLNEYFDGFIKSCLIKMRKPNLDIFEYAIASLGFKPSQIVFVDDNSANVIASKQAGMDGLIFTNETKLREDLKERGLLNA